MNLSLSLMQLISTHRSSPNGQRAAMYSPTHNSYSNNNNNNYFNHNINSHANHNENSKRFRTQSSRSPRNNYNGSDDSYEKVIILYLSNVLIFFLLLCFHFLRPPKTCSTFFSTINKAVTHIVKRSS